MQIRLRLLRAVLILIVIFMATAPAALFAARKPKAVSQESPPDPPMAAAKFTIEKVYAQVLQFAADGKRLIAGVTVEGSQFAVQERDPTTGQLVRTLFSGEIDGGHDHAAISANGRILAIAMVGKNDTYGMERTISVINLMNGKPLASLTGHEKTVYGLSLSGDGRILASGSDDYRTNAEGKSYSTGQVRIWNLASRKLLYEQPDAKDFRASLDSVTISRDGSTAAWLAPKEIHVIDVADAKESAVIHPRGDAWGICLSPDGKTLGVLGHTYAALVDIESKKSRCEFIIKPQGRALGAFSADGRTFVFSAHYVMVSVDASSGKALGYTCIENKNNYLQRFALSPDGKMLAGKFTFQGPGALRGFDATTLQTEELDRIAVVAPAELPGSPEDVLEGHAAAAAAPRILKLKSGSSQAKAAAAARVASNSDHPDGIAGTMPAQASRSPAADAPAQSDGPSTDNKPSQSSRAGTGSSRGSDRPARGSPPPHKEDAAAFVGTWSAIDSKQLVQTWTISREVGDWKITGTFAKGGKIVGSFHGDSISFDGSELFFKRVLDKKPTADAIETVRCKARSANGKLRIAFDGGGKKWTQALSPASE